MIQIALAPCSPFSVDQAPDAARAPRWPSASTAGCTRISPRRRDEDAFCLEVYGCRPLRLLEEVGWLGPRTWLAHGIHFTCEECETLGRHGVGVCHCPTSNAVLASGFCKTRELEAAGAPVGLGVDGSASNDNSNLMEGVRHALMVNRLHYGSASAVTHLDAFRWATRGLRPLPRARRYRRDRAGPAGRPGFVHARRAALFRRARSAGDAGAVRRAPRRPGDGRAASGAWWTACPWASTWPCAPAR